MTGLQICSQCRQFKHCFDPKRVNEPSSNIRCEYDKEINFLNGSSLTIIPSKGQPFKGVDL